MMIYIFEGVVILASLRILVEFTDATVMLDMCDSGCVSADARSCLAVLYCAITIRTFHFNRLYAHNVL